MTPEIALFPCPLLRPRWFVRSLSVGNLLSGTVLLLRARDRQTREPASAFARPILQKAVVEYIAGGSETGVLRAHLANQLSEINEEGGHRSARRRPF
jgi:hypothetical protein